MNECKYCKKSQCVWDSVSDTVLEHVRIKQHSSRYSNNELRKIGYKKVVQEIYGVLGHGNRVQLPQCVLNGVWSEYPDNDGIYMGHKDH